MSASRPEIDWDALLRELEARHGAHTVLLYGSHARGDATPTSDLDLVALRPGPFARDLGAWRGHALDVHLVPDAETDVQRLATTRAASLRDARVLCQRGDLGDRVLAGVRARLARPPDALSPGEAAAHWAWGDKMRARIAHPEPLTRALHRATLLAEALPAWAHVRGRWYFGAKAALRSMREDDPTLARAYAAAAAPGAATEAFLRLLDAVFDAALPRPPTHGPTEPPSAS